MQKIHFPAQGCKLPERVLHIIEGTAADHGVSVADILGRRRTRKISDARHSAMWRVRSISWKGMGWHGRPSYPQIGRWFRRDHTTVLLAIKRVSEVCFLRPEDYEPVSQPHGSVDREPKRESMAA